MKSYRERKRERELCIRSFIRNLQYNTFEKVEKYYIYIIYFFFQENMNLNL